MTHVFYTPRDFCGQCRCVVRFRKSLVRFGQRLTTSASRFSVAKFRREQSKESSTAMAARLLSWKPSGCAARGNRKYHNAIIVEEDVVGRIYTRKVLCVANEILLSRDVVIVLCKTKRRICIYPNVSSYTKTGNLSQHLCMKAKNHPYRLVEPLSRLLRWIQCLFRKQQYKHE